MKKRHYLRVTYALTGRRNESLNVQEFAMSETRLINYVVKGLAIDGKCNVELIECSQEEYKSKFQKS
jgi:hypothetical protein